MAMNNSSVFSADTLVQLFDNTFLSRYNTVLRGGYAEPEYLPATDEAVAQLHFREDFFRSALHEIAHWCVAGAARRQQPDFGYWYAPEGRSGQQQEAFMALEVLPQSYEWLFCAAAGHPFDVSLDDFSALSEQRLQVFRQRVNDRVREIVAAGMPARVANWCGALSQHYRQQRSWQNDWLDEVAMFRAPE